MCSELIGDFLKQVEYVQCKLQAKYLMQQHLTSQKSQEMQIDTSPVKVSKNTANVKHDNLFDILYSDKLRMKE